MKYEKQLEEYQILENDGTAPFEKDVRRVLISYLNQKPTEAMIIGVQKNTENEKTHSFFGIKPTIRIEKDTSKLAKIVEFFNKK